MSASGRLEKLEDFFPWSASANLNGEFITCTDHGSMTCDFAFDSLLVRQLQQPNPTVILACLHKPRRHYDMILRRGGLDAVSLEAEGRLHVVEAPLLQCLWGNNSRQGATCEDDAPTYALSPEEGVLVLRPAPGNACGVNGSLQSLAPGTALLTELKAILGQKVQVLQAGMSSPSLFIDDIDCFGLLAESTQAATEFLIEAKSHWCKAAGAALTVVCGRTTPASSARGGTHDDSAARASGTGSLAEYCSYLASISVTALPLRSGYSNDTHGLLHVSHKLLSRTLQFKLSDAAIKCGVVGDRALVL